uniref:Transposase n=1 Tax=Heterorhabditis bacteriophora TaxID=37862 RepID=A0A1I7XSK0_HETBA
MLIWKLAGLLNIAVARLFQTTTTKKRDLQKWKYDWERAIMGQEWRPLTKMHKEKNNMEALADKIKRHVSTLNISAV